MENIYIVRLIENVDGIELATIIENERDLSNFLIAYDKDKFQITDIEIIDCGLTQSTDFYKKIEGLEFGQ